MTATTQEREKRETRWDRIGIAASSASMMMPGLWAGRRVTSVDDYAGVLVPLDEAHLHSHSYRLGRRTSLRESSEDDTTLEEGADDGDGVKVPGEDEGTAMLEMTSAPEYSIEGLRKEVRRGGKGEKWTDYESKLFLLVSLDVRAGSKWCCSEVQTHQQGHPGHRHGEI